MFARKKIVFFVPNTVGGAERVTITIAKLLDSKKFEVQFAIVGQTIGEIRQFIPERFKVSFIKIRGIWDFATYKIYRFLAKARPNVVFSSLCYLNSRVSLAAHLNGSIKIIIRNNNNYFAEKNVITKFLRRTCYPLADVIVMQTEEMAEEFIKFFPGKCENIQVIHNPIDIDTIEKCTKNIENPFDASYVNYVYVGRITEIKGLDILVSAYAKVVDVLPKSRLYIVGKINVDDLFYASLKTLLRKKKIENKVVFVGFTPNPYQYIKYANCLVLPSRMEGLPNVVLEAMYLQCPVVVTRSIPIIDRLVSIDKGIVVNVEDEEGLFKAMVDILSCNHISNEFQYGDNEKFIKLFE